MIEIKGKHNTAKVFTDNIESSTIAQIHELCNQEFVFENKIRIMPDCHTGAGCVIGTTMTIKDKVVPNLVGVDIGCGMARMNVGQQNINLERLDNLIRRYIPSGQNVHDEELYFPPLYDLRCKNHINMNRALCSIGTLGGGNHFIEVDIDSENNKHIVVHSGSRHLGKQVAKYYQEKAYQSLVKNQSERVEIIERLKREGRQSEIEKELGKIKKINIPKALAYVENQEYQDYLYDMKIVQEYASLNRMMMLRCIAEGFLEMDFRDEDCEQTIHNYIDLDNMILRKGAVSAKKGERLLIPINMRDGSLLCIGKGNPDWNYSAPHGAGRIFSRGQAKEKIELKDFVDSMKGIFTTSVNDSTIDESPMAYKPMDEIIENIKDTVDIIETLKPIYNFKANS